MKPKEEYKRGKALRDTFFIRNSADKAFLALVEALNGYIQTKTGILPKDHTSRRNFLREMGREDLRAEYSDIMRDLHDECFYGGRIVERDIERAFEKLEEFIEKIKAGV